MKKTERINLIMRYINNRSQFTIREIQEEFKISRATAIRDIQEIEAMGFPLVTEKGRGGGYFVMPNSYLPAVRFTADELRAVMIAFLSSQNAQLPYLRSRQTLTEKLLGIASQSQQDELIELSQLLLFESTNPANPGLLELDDQAPPELNQIIQLAVKSRFLEITYELSPGWPERLKVYVLHIINTESQWFLEVYNLAKEAFQFLSVIQLKNSELLEDLPDLSPEEILDKHRFIQREGNLEVSLDAAAIRRFKRMHPPGIVLEFTGMFQTSGQFRTRLDVGDGEQLDYFVHWLMYLGKGIRFRRIPEELARLMKEELLEFDIMIDAIE